MTPEIVNLVEAARALGLVRTGKPAPRCIRIVGDPRDLPRKLDILQETLEAVDASGALSADGISPPSPPGQEERLRKALDGLLRLIQVNGLDMEPAIDIVEDALGLADEATAERRSSFETLPMFAPRAWKKKKRLSPRLQLLPDLPGDVGLSELRKAATAARRTADMMGGAFGRESRRIADEIDRMAATVVPTAPPI